MPWVIWLRISKVGVGDSGSRNFRAQADSSPFGSLYCGMMNWRRSGNSSAIIEKRIEISGIVRRQRKLFRRIVLDGRASK